MAQIDTAAKTQERAKGTDREPSSARSASDRGTGVELACASDRVGGCCEPRTARGPVVVSQIHRLPAVLNRAHGEHGNSANGNLEDTERYRSESQVSVVSDQ